MKIEKKIGAVTKLVHEPPDKPVPRGVARNDQVVLKDLKEQAKLEAASNKRTKVNKKKLAKLATAKAALRNLSK
jgi:hypothetical protein